VLLCCIISSLLKALLDVLPEEVWLDCVDDLNDGNIVLNSYIEEIVSIQRSSITLVAW